MIGLVTRVDEETISNLVNGAASIAVQARPTGMDLGGARFLIISWSILNYLVPSEIFGNRITEIPYTGNGQRIVHPTIPTLLRRCITAALRYEMTNAIHDQNRL